MRINKVSNSIREIDNRLFLLHNLLNDYDSLLMLVNDKLTENNNILKNTIHFESDIDIKQQINSQPETLLGESYINIQQNELITRSFFLILYSLFEDGFYKILFLKLEEKGNYNTDLFELISKDKIESVKKVYSKIFGIEFGKKPFQNIWSDILILKDIRNRMAHNDMKYKKETMKWLVEKSLWKNEAAIMNKEIVKYLYDTIGYLFELLKKI